MRLAIAIFILLACLPGLHTLHGDWNSEQLGQVELTDFQSCGFDENNQLSWQISGSHAQVYGAMTTVKNCQLVFYQKTTEKERKFLQVKQNQSGLSQFTVKTPKCQFNHALGEIKSNEAIVIEMGGDNHISGNGFDIDLNKHIVLIRSTVYLKMHLPKHTINPLNTGFKK